MNKVVFQAAKSGTFLLGGNLGIHRMGFGAMRLTGPGIWGEPKNPTQAKEVLRRAIELGVNFIDTADSYGPEVSEAIIAETLYPYPSNLVIATKGGLTRQGPNKWSPVGRPEYLRQCVEMSLRRLKKDCIELYQFHKIDPLVSLGDSLGALIDLQMQGKIRYIGLSNVTVAEIKQAQSIINIVSVQNLYNFTDRHSEDVLQYCEANQMAFIPWYPIASGDLVNQKGKLEEFSNQKGISPAQAALSWLLKRSPVMIPIPGTSSTKHLEENISAASIELTQQEFDQLENA